jgi:hypothetical protein
MRLPCRLLLPFLSLRLPAQPWRRSQCRHKSGRFDRPACLKSRAAGSWAWERPLFSTTRTVLAENCTGSASCLGGLKGLPLHCGTGMGRGFGVCPGFCAKPYRAKPRQARPFGGFHRQTAVFRELVREMPTKYKILWFGIDMYHGQRYFFICGCNRTVKKDRPSGAIKKPR